MINVLRYSLSLLFLGLLATPANSAQLGPIDGYTSAVSGICAVAAHHEANDTPDIVAPKRIKLPVNLPDAIFEYVKVGYSLVVHFNGQPRAPPVFV